MNTNNVIRVVMGAMVGVIVGTIAQNALRGLDDRNIVAHYTDEAGNVATLKKELTADKFELLDDAIKQKASPEGIKIPLLWKEVADKLPECKRLPNPQIISDCLVNVIKAAK